MVKTATAAGDAASSVLRFWRDTEIFNVPQAPKVKDGNERLCIRHLVAGEALPWVRGHRGTLLPPSVDEDWVHAVYVGVAKAREWAEVVLCVVSPQERLQEDDLQRIGGHGWLGAFVVTSEGFAVTDSFVPAGFSIGVERLREGKTLDGLSASIEAMAEAFKSRRKTVKADGESGSPAGGQDRQLAATVESGAQEPVAPTPSAGTPITWQDLDQELSKALRPFGNLVKAMKFGVVVKSSLRKLRRTDDDDAKVELDIEFLNSFYLDDLDRLISQADEGREFGAGLNRYLGPDNPHRAPGHIEAARCDGGVPVALANASRSMAGTEVPSPHAGPAGGGRRDLRPDARCCWLGVGQRAARHRENDPAVRRDR